jgi:hypothetical protein
MLRVDTGASVHIRNGEVQSNGRLKGKMILPFEKWTETLDQQELVPGEFVHAHEYSNEVDSIREAIEKLGASGDISEELMDTFIEGLITFGLRVQQNGLLICPGDPALQDRCASVAVDINNWNGGGFLMDNAILTPANIVERSLGSEMQDGKKVELQRVQAIKLDPGKVTIDLDRERSIAATPGMMTPSECGKDFWVGLVLKGGNLSLPKDFVRTKSGEPIKFKLKEGEMIYDLNGFNYQSYLTATKPEGEPASFGEQLGDFADVMVHDCMLDLYANRVNVEINCTVALQVFDMHEINAKLYSDDVTGRRLCAVAPTAMKDDAFIKGYDIVIDGGWFKFDGVHLNGRMILPGLDQDARVKANDFLPFTDMIIPSRRIMMNPDSSSYKEKYGAVSLNRPAIVNFNDFDVTVRKMKLEFIRSVANRLTLTRSTQLGETIPLLSKNTDTIVVQSQLMQNPGFLGRDPGAPTVLYDMCEATLENSFDESLEFAGTLKPKYMVLQGGDDDGLVEYEAETGFLFTYLNAISGLPLSINGRFGYDKIQERLFFAIGFQVNMPIVLGPGQILGAAGIVASNMVVKTDPEHQDRLDISNIKKMGDYIDEMQVHRGSNSTFVAGLRGKLVIAGVCVVDNMYFGFTNGPIVEAGGDLYISLGMDSVLDETSVNANGDKGSLSNCLYLGDVLIRYHHPNRHFSCNLAIGTEVMGIQITGNLGFEVSPSLFRIYLGYPDALTAEFKINVAKMAEAHIKVEYGQEYQVGGEYGAHARIKQSWEADAFVDLDVIYVYTYAYVGGEGMIKLRPAVEVTLEVWLGGKIVGGIRFFGEHDVIRLQLDAWGKMTARIKPEKYWELEAKCTVSYGIDLGLGSISGSKTVHLDKRINL